MAKKDTEQSPLEQSEEVWIPDEGIAQPEEALIPPEDMERPVDEEEEIRQASWSYWS